MAQFYSIKTLRVFTLVGAIVCIVPSLVMAVIDPVQGFAFYGRFLMIGLILGFIYISLRTEGRGLRYAGRDPAADYVSSKSEEANAKREGEIGRPAPDAELAQTPPPPAPGTRTL